MEEGCRHLVVRRGRCPVGERSEVQAGDACPVEERSEMKEGCRLVVRRGRCSVGERSEMQAGDACSVGERSEMMEEYCRYVVVQKGRRSVGELQAV